MAEPILKNFGACWDEDVAARDAIREKRKAERLAARAAAGDASARDSLVRAHLRLVVDEAIRYRGVGDRMRDLVPQAFDALVEAAREYTPPSDEGFTAYARRSIRSALTGRYGPH